MVAAVVGTGAVVVGAAATAATVAVIAETVVVLAAAAAAAGSVAGTAVVEIAVERIVGKSTEARLRTWYGDSERP
jgi:hypothetical protein